MAGLVVSALGLVFGLVIFMRLKNMPVHASMLEVSELIYETCKTYLLTQGKFLLLLECFIGVIIIFYYGVLQGFDAFRVVIIVLFSLVGITGSFLVAAFGMRVNTFANSRTRLRQPDRQAIPLLRHSAAGRHEHRDAVDLGRVAHHALHPALRARQPGRPVLHRLRHRRVSGRGRAARGGRHLHEDRRHRIGSDEDRVQDQGRRRAQPGRDCGLHGRQRGRFGGTLGRRFRDLRRHRRRIDHLHPAGGHYSDRSSAVAGLDLLDARHDGHRQRRRLLRQRLHRQGPLRQRRQDELRDAADHAGVADLAAFDRPDLRAERADDPGSRRRHNPVVEALHGDQLRHAGRGIDSRVREDLHLHQLTARP